MAVTATKENHAKEALRTHYYTCNYQKAKEAIIQLAQVMGYQVQHMNDQFNEVLLVKGAVTVLVEITMITQRETGIDFNIETSSFFDFGKGQKEIARFYQYLDKTLPFKGISLHR